MKIRKRKKGKMSKRNNDIIMISSNVLCVMVKHEIFPKSKKQLDYWGNKELKAISVN